MALNKSALLSALPAAPAVPAGGPGASTDTLARAHAHAGRLPASVQDHGGDAALWHAAQEMAALGLNGDDALQVLEQSFNVRCTPPWDRAALVHKVSRAVAEQQKLWDMYPPARARALAVAEVVPLTSADMPYRAPATGGAAGDDVFSLKIDFGMDPPPRNYRVDDFEWGAGRPLGLLASFNASKTLISKQIVVDYVMGSPILGKYQIGRRDSGRVLDFAYEQITKAQWTYERMARAAGEDPRALGPYISAGRPKYHLSDGMRPRSREEMVYIEDWLLRACEGFDIGLVDPYSAAALGLDESSSAIQEPARLLERVSEQTGCAFMICVHRGRDQEAEHARGHSSIDDAFDTTILISKDDEKQPNRRTFKCKKRPMYGFADAALQIDDVNEDGSPWKRKGDERESWGVRVSVVGAAPAVSGTMQRRVDKLVGALKRQPGRWLTPKQARELTRLDGKVFPDVLDKAVELGLVNQAPDTGRRDGIVISYAEPAPVADTPTEQALDAATTRSGSRFAKHSGRSSEPR